MLDELRARGVKLAILTNKDHEAAVPLVARYFGTERFEIVQGRTTAFPAKPDPQVTRHVLDALGAEAGTALYVGDSDVDIACGHNAGLRSAGVSWGFRGRKELELAGADYVVDSPDELIDIVLNS